MDKITCIKFCVKNEIKCADAFRMLTVAYGEATLDQINVYRWYKMFSEGREYVNDDERAGRPSTSTTDEKIDEVEKMILANRRITVREVAEDLYISIGSCHSIFIIDLGMRRVAAKFVPKLLNCDQKQHRMNIANEMLDSVRDDPNLLQRVITGDEAWVYGYDEETKAQSSQWKLPHEPRPKKARHVRSNVKVLLTVFFDCRGVVHPEFSPQGRTVNKEYYLQVMRNLREAIRQKRPDLWKNKNWLLHHDNVPAHTSFLVRDFLAKNNALMMPQPSYSPDLAPCDFFLFPKLKRPMTGRRYATLDEIKTASKEELKKILKNDFLKCVEDCEDRWHKCIISHGVYFEGDKIGFKMAKLKKACETKRRTLESVIAEADGELGKQEPCQEMLMSLRPKLLRCKDREDEEIEDVDIVQANIFGRSEGVLQKMEQLLAKPTVGRESIVSGGNEGKSNLHRLPKLELPKFGGEAREWLQFWLAFQSVHDDDSISACVKFQYLQNCMIKGSVSEEIVSSFPNEAANYPLAISTLKERFGREDMLVEVYVRDLIAIILENAYGRKTSFSTVYVRLSSQLRALGSLGVTTDKCAAILYPMVESALPEDLFVAWERTRHHHKPDEDGKHKSSEVLLEKLMEFLEHEVEGSERMRLARQPFSSSYPSQFNRDKPPKPKTSVATAASLVVADEDKKIVKSTGNKRKYVEDYLKYGFIPSVKDPSLPFCLICQKTLSNETMVPSKLLRHIETNHREQMNNPISYFENIRSSFQKQSKKFKKFMTTSDEAQTASYMIAQLIARKKKAHAEAEEIILPALKIVAGCMLTNDAMEKVTKIPLSSKTIARRIEDMSEDIELQIKQYFNDSSTKWAIQLDETTDVSNKAQLLAFLRFVDTGKIVNNYYFCKELKQRTTGADIFELVDENVMKYNLRWENCVSVCTDGAPSMKDEVVKVVNYIKSNALRSRIFSTFCEAMDSDYKNLLFHTEVRWLSKGKVLNRFISMKNEIMAFIDNEEINFPFMMSDVWWLRVSFLGDIFDKLNSLNLNLQGAQENIITISTKLKAFKEKLSLWNLNIAKENFASFPMVQENPSKSIIKKEVEETLTLLSASFDKYFPYLDVEKMEWVVNPFMHCEIQHLEEEMQENLIDLKNDLVFKRLFTEKELSEFWLCLNSKFPKLSNAAIESLLPFGSSYLCEQGFSTLTEMKSKKRERLQMIDEEMRVCLSQPGHISKKCRNVVKCAICSRKHWAIVCPVSKGSQKSDGIEEKSKNIDASVDMSNRVRSQDVLLQTIMVKINGENKSKVVRAILDSGSQNSYVLEQTASEVGLTMLGKKEVEHLGWTVSGKVLENVQTTKSRSSVLSCLVRDATIQDLWRLDVIGIMEPMKEKSKEELSVAALEHFNQTVKQNEDGRYSVNLPWIGGHPPLPNYKLISEKKLESTTARLEKNNRACRFGIWHVLSHHGVIKPESQSTPVRPVFNASFRTKGNPSLNDCLEVGLNMLENIPDIITRFRLGPVAVTSDIRKAFLQIEVAEEDRNYLQFWWYKNQKLEEKQMYRHCRVVFGVSSSPFLLAAKTIDILRRSMYVDNCVASVGSKEDALKFKEESVEIFGTAKMDLREWEIGPSSEEKQEFCEENGTGKSDKKEDIIGSSFIVRPDWIHLLELVACEIGSRLAVHIKSMMEFEDIPITLWTDSTTALAWIKRDMNWSVFVAGRVKKIRQNSSITDRRHVPGKENPADILSRGASIPQLITTRWWEGPVWLKKEEQIWTQSVEKESIEEVNSELRKAVVTHFNIEKRDMLAKITQFSNYHKILRMVAYWRRFLDWLQRKRSNKITKGPITMEEMTLAEEKVIRLVQQCSYEGVKDKKFKNLRVYEDENGLLRVKCRFVPVEKVDAHSYPMVIPSNGVTGQLIWSYHRLMCHAGVQSLHANLRERYWILNSRRTIRNEIRPCARCRCFRAQPCYVEEGPLPKDRVRMGPAFDVTGVDMTGPLHLKGNKRYWIAIFTCDTYRAIHLELCTSFTTETFVGAMRRFVARRGRPSTIYSDNGLNFVGCKNLFSSLDWNKIVEYGAINRISWKFNPPTACWRGGFKERMIRIVKQLLRSVLGSARVTNEELQTLLCEVEAVVNNRPLTDELRARFTKEYLAMLVHYRKAKKSRRIEVGEIVLIGNDQKRRISWPLGKLEEVLPGADGQVRVARVKTSSGVFLRPVQRLFPLEIKQI
ncbi:hypothetical protein LAZ67_21002496 [Cordylochernes scorpioides]|uniref:Integrase catalytic domain-containing protein n=1 Tax=Cordylochernes scorpioides TaxID=51811 RepID=A0ABY6LRX7_9ARAC|nr:hypothetical protein LAZ67_21002496 [Cordylochernes scorpioides]